MSKTVGILMRDRVSLQNFIIRAEVFTIPLIRTEIFQEGTTKRLM